MKKFFYKGELIAFFILFSIGAFLLTLFNQLIGLPLNVDEVLLLNVAIMEIFPIISTAMFSRNIIWGIINGTNMKLSLTLYNLFLTAITYKEYSIVSPLQKLLIVIDFYWQINSAIDFLLLLILSFIILTFVVVMSFFLWTIFDGFKDFIKKN